MPLAVCVIAFVPIEARNRLFVHLFTMHECTYSCNGVLAAMPHRAACRPSTHLRRGHGRVFGFPSPAAAAYTQCNVVYKITTHSPGSVGSPATSRPRDAQIPEPAVESPLRARPPGQWRRHKRHVAVPPAPTACASASRAGAWRLYVPHHLSIFLTLCRPVLNPYRKANLLVLLISYPLIPERACEDCCRNPLHFVSSAISEQLR